MDGPDSPPPVGQFNLEDEYGGFLDILVDHLNAVDNVEHHGVKGMKWGVRKADNSSPREPLKSLGPDSVTRKTASGETITLKKTQPTALHKLLGRISKSYRDEYAKGATLDILDGSGKKVGDAIVDKKNDDELYLNWLGIDKSARGKGYATAVMQAGRDFGKQEGFKRMTLEVPGNSPDARHIYEKLGFKVTKEAEDKNDFWGGLTEMAYEFDAKHSLDEVLAHYGIKGMKWGVRRDNPSGSAPKPQASSDHESAAATKAKVKAGGLKSLSNEELKTYLERMDLEKRYRKGNPGPKEEAGKFIKDMLLQIGKEEAKKFAGKQVAQLLSGRS